MKSRLAILFFAIVSVYIIFNTEAYRKNMFQWDMSGYYLYLPAIFIYHDLGNFHFYHDVNQTYELSRGTDAYALPDQPTGKKNDKYAVGTALFELPFFLVAHAYATHTHVYAADGYSYPYQFAGIFSSIFWVTVGLFFLRGLLKQYFSEGITALTLICIAFGTNIYCYTIFVPGMSHTYGFFLFAAIIYATERYYRTDRSKYIYAIGALLGLVLITRPVNIIVAIIPLFWEVYNRQTLIARIKLLGNEIKRVVIAVLILLLIASIQMSYWKYTTNHWIYYSYTDEGFNFLRPHIIKGLFSYQKGWLVYTPMVAICFIGMYHLWRQNRKLFPAICSFMLLLLYAVFSWRGWWYGGSFSARAMIESLPVAAIPLAYLIQAIYAQNRRVIIKVATTMVLIFFIALNMFQSYQYSIGIIHYVLMSKDYYWRTFGKLHVTDEDRKHLMSWDEYLDENTETEASTKH